MESANEEERLNLESFNEDDASSAFLEELPEVDKDLINNENDAAAVQHALRNGADVNCCYREHDVSFEDCIFGFGCIFFKIVCRSAHSSRCTAGAP